MNNEERLKRAVEFLKESKSFMVGDLQLEDNENNFNVIGWSNYQFIENLSMQHALIELNEIKNLFKLMIENNHELKIFIENKNIAYELRGDETGKSSITICIEKNNELIWKTELKKNL